jgi:hypothetical protein
MIVLLWPNTLPASGTVKRLRYTSDLPMSAADLAEVRRSFSTLSTDGLRSAYSDALERCKLDKRGQPPRADQIQVLVSVWKVLGKGR